MAASATFALKAAVWFRRGRRDIVSPDSRATACPPSGRNSTYRPVQISGTGSECFRRLRRIAHHKAGARVRQVKSEEVDLARRATDDADRFPEVGLRMSRRMHQRYEHLLRSLPPAGHVILHDRDPTREAVLISQPLENPLRRMLLLLRP